MNKTYKTLVILIVVLVIVAIGAWAIVGMHSNNTAATAVQTNPGAPIETSVTMTSTTTTTTATTTSYTLAEVATHNTAADCWMAINGNVYNVTPFIPRHPGGPIIIKACGTDATAVFNNRPNGSGPHPASANQILQTLYIGTLAS